MLEAIIGSNNLSEAATKQQYYDSIRRQIELSVEKIQVIKTELAKQKQAQENQLETLNSLKSDQVARQNSLHATKNSKNRLLKST